MNPKGVVDGVRPERRILVNENRISREQSRQIHALIFRMNSEPSEDILVEFDSPGGSHRGGVYLHDIFRNSKARVIGLASGNVDSTAFNAFMGCHLRFATTHSEFIVHRPVWEFAYNIEENTSEKAFISSFHKARNEVRRECKKFRKMLLRCADGKMTMKEIVELTNNVRRIGVEEALRFGFIHAVI